MVKTRIFLVGRNDILEKFLRLFLFFDVSLRDTYTLLRQVFIEKNEETSRNNNIREKKATKQHEAKKYHYI